MTRSLLTVTVLLGTVTPVLADPAALGRLKGHLDQLKEARAAGSFEDMDRVARAALREAETSFGNHEFTAEMSTQVGLVLMERGDLTGAVPFFDRALELRETDNLPFKSTGQPNEPWRQFHAIISLRNRGYLALRKHDHNRADTLLQRGLARLDNSPVLQGAISAARLDLERASLLLQLGQVDEELGRFASAEKRLSQAISIAQKLGPLGLVTLGAAYNAYGILLGRLDRINEAREALAEAERIREDLFQSPANQVQARRELAETRNNLGWALMNLGKVNEARSSYELAIDGMTKLRGSDHPSLGQFYANIAETYARDPSGADLRQAQFWLRKCLSVLRANDPEGRLTNPLTIAVARINLARWVHAREGDWTSALEQIDLARQLLNQYARTVLSTRPEAEQLDFLINKERNWFHTAVSIAVQAGKAGRPDAAQVSAAWVLNAKGLSRELLAEQIRAKAPEFVLRGLRDRPWITSADVAKRVPSQSSLVEFVRYQPLKFDSVKEWDWAEPHYAAWVLASDSSTTRVIDLGAASAIDSKVDSVRKHLAKIPSRLGSINFKQDDQDLREAMQPIYQQVIAPLAIASVSKWIISPDGPLWLLPWSALPEGQGYVAERHHVRLLATGRELTTSRADEVQPGPAVVFSDIDYGGSAPFKPLSASAAEGLIVSKSLKDLTGVTPQSITGDAATSQAFRRVSRPRVLYVSTHGVSDVRQEAPSYAKSISLADATDPLDVCLLAFAGADSEGRSGIVLGRQILSMDLLGTEAVILSACNTGTGQLRSDKVSEGVASLSHAFRLAGARAVVGTLWEVEDRHTTQLMQSLFKHLKTDKDRDWAEALRLAQTDRIESLRDPDSLGVAHPFFWAGVTLVGP